MSTADSTSNGVSSKRRPSHFPESAKDAPYHSAIRMAFSHTVSEELEPELGGRQESAIWKGQIDDQFLTGVSPFGGYVAGIILEAARQEVRRQGLAKRFAEPVSCSAVFLEGGRPGPYFAVVTPRRVGGRFAVFDVTVRQEAPAKEGSAGSSFSNLVTANVTMSDLSNERGVTTLLSNDGRTPITSPFDPPALPATNGPPMSIVDSSSTAPSFPVGLGLPTRENCIPRAKMPAGYRSPRTGKAFNDFTDILDQPHTKEELKIMERGTEWAKWVRWNSGDIQDTVSLGFWSDYYASPVMFESHPREGRIWMPTMDYHLQIRAIPDPSLEWVLLHSRNRYTTNGRKEFDVEVWDETGRLLAIARQMTISIPMANRVKKAPHSSKL
ncbi:hypothetical protein M427DRAFT_56750 [Gonapodya prolifera JEL478]|uniref:Thioesterase/thiol ester dehydrase-isomerase n=1 Tax=Gonapodya prolifera (strain JEL478) TaxID=1344416 RepID=A0A139AG37_GONPJ|nr:hypothetical protein M427DRAFT_56750 [Gonapodya prolifera JEL478]|eukprot:KXS15395.1 hypothetical protein M427DRAFT_56750 [Gonapodya prolifera JEL478]